MFFTRFMRLRVDQAWLHTSLGPVFSASDSLLPPCWQLLPLKWSSSPNLKTGGKHAAPTERKHNHYLLYFGGDGELNVRLLS